MTDDFTLISLAIGTSTAIGLIIYRVSRTWRIVRDDPVPSEVREHSHAVANETTVVRAGLQRLKKERDPLTALVEAIHGRQE